MKIDRLILGISCTIIISTFVAVWGVAYAEVSKRMIQAQEDETIYTYTPPDSETEYVFIITACSQPVHVILATNEDIREKAVVTEQEKISFLKMTGGRYSNVVPINLKNLKCD